MAISWRTARISTFVLVWHVASRVVSDSAALAWRTKTRPPQCFSLPAFAMGATLITPMLPSIETVVPYDAESFCCC